MDVEKLGFEKKVRKCRTRTWLAWGGCHIRAALDPGFMNGYHCLHFAFVHLSQTPVALGIETSSGGIPSYVDQQAGYVKHTQALAPYVETTSFPVLALTSVLGQPKTKSDRPRMMSPVQSETKELPVRSLSSLIGSGLFEFRDIRR
jgi:hypothetical protein